MSTVKWPTIRIPANTISVVLNVFGYDLFLDYSNATIDLTKGERQPTREELQAWYANLAAPTFYAGRSTETVIEHVEEAHPIETSPISTGIPWLDTLLESITRTLQPISDALTSASQSIATTLKQWQEAGHQVGKFFTWLDTPQTIERLAVASLGFMLIILGMVAFLMSFTDINLADVAKVATL